MNIENPVSPEMAEQEMERWMDHKKIRPKKREAQKEAIETLIEAIIDGDLSLDENHNFHQKLIHPPSPSVDKLVFAPRMNMGAVRKKLKGIRITEDTTGYLMGYVATLTSQPNAIIESLDSDDYKIGQAIAGFFIS